MNTDELINVCIDTQKSSPWRCI